MFFGGHHLQRFSLPFKWISLSAFPVHFLFLCLCQALCFCFRNRKNKPKEAQWRAGTENALRREQVIVCCFYFLLLGAEFIKFVAFCLVS